MSIASETEPASAPINALVSVNERVAAGRVPWTGPLLLVVTRPVLFLTMQAVLAVVFSVLHRTSPWRAAGAWWNVYGTLVDIGCLIGLRYFTRREGIRVRDLLGPIRLRYGRDLFLGLGYFVLVFPLFGVGGYLSQVLLWGSPAKAPIAFLMQAHTLRSGQRSTA